jgi:two-component system aerobic respiration control protein ArcA
MDVGLPWINGFELATMMKSNEDLRHIPIVFLSGHADREMIQKGFSVGANDYITKPFEVDKVQKTIQTLLELSK